MNLQEIITAKVPGAVYTEAGDGMFTIPVEQFHDLARYLHDDPAPVSYTHLTLPTIA